MLPDLNYMMESDSEALRLDLKTNCKTIEDQALWAGVQPGMRLVDLGCGPGKTTATLHQLVQPGGAAVGIDASEHRIAFAQQHYGDSGAQFIRRDIREPLDDLGQFDFVWVRFVLEYFLANGFEVVHNISRILNPGGILCLVDLDYNCLTHYGLSERLERTFLDIVHTLQSCANFDPFAGRKLYSHLYRLGYKDIKVDVRAHHLIFGELNDTDGFNWMKKLEVAVRKIDYPFHEYSTGYAGFLDEFTSYFNDPGRFIYSPVICCCGHK